MKFSNVGLSLDPFIQSRKCVSLKLKGEFCVMRMKNDAKFETELTCHLKIDMKNFNGLILIKQRRQTKLASVEGGRVGVETNTGMNIFTLRIGSQKILNMLKTPCNIFYSR